MSLLEMSLAGGLIILAAALLRGLAKDRLPVGMFEALWAVAWLRLMVPVRLPFRWSAWTLIRRALSHAAGPGPVYTAVAAPGQGTSHAVDIIQNIPTAGSAAPGRPFPIATVLWLTGAALCAGVFLAGYIRACRRFRAAEATQENYVNQIPAAHPLRRRVAVRLTEDAAAPLTYGILRPVILLPRSLPEGAAGFVLAHEQAHIRRLDTARKLALAAALCLHWFNPLVWLMRALACRDMERACDRAVIRAMGPQARRDYARTLLDMEERRAGLTALASGFSKNAIEERIHSIMKIKPRSFLSTLLALALVLTVGAAFATAAPEDEAADEAVIGGADAPTYIILSDGVSTVLTGDVVQTQDGTVYVFTADGKPVSMTQQEYKLLFEPAEVEWWTAEEYAAWLEQEKIDLQDSLGERAWTNGDGWFTWTQEKIDETIEMYEQILEEIKNGLLVSKSVDGSADAVLMQGDADPVPESGGQVSIVPGDAVTYSFNGGESVPLTEEQLAALETLLADPDVADAMNVAVDEELYRVVYQMPEGRQEELDALDEALAPYLPFQVWCSYDPASDEITLTWTDADGRKYPVRGLWDETAGIWITPHAGDGWPEDAIELIAVYADGELTGLRPATEEEQAQWDALRRENARAQEIALPLAEPDGTVTVPPDERYVEFFAQADGVPYGQLESGGSVLVAEVTAAVGNAVSVGIQTRTDAAITVSLEREDGSGISRPIQLQAGQMQTVSFYPGQAGSYELCLTNEGEYSVEFIVSYVVS